MTKLRIRNKGLKPGQQPVTVWTGKPSPGYRRTRQLERQVARVIAAREAQVATGSKRNWRDFLPKAGGEEA